MTHFLRPLILICASFVASVGCDAADVPAREDIAILSAIVTNHCDYAASHPEDRHNILSAQASVVHHKFVVGGLDPGALDSLALRNKTAHDLPSLALCKAYELVPQAKIDAAMDERELNGARAGWRGLHKAFPRITRISYLSLPGYSADGTVAIVQVSSICDAINGSCSYGFYWVIRKVGGKWTIEKSVPVWVS